MKTRSNKLKKCSMDNNRLCLKLEYKILGCLEQEMVLKEANKCSLIHFYKTKRELISISFSKHRINQLDCNRMMVNIMYTCIIGIKYEIILYRIIKSNTIILINSNTKN
jgi:hypothetical protein